MTSIPHIPVLLEPILQYTPPNSRRMIDGTLGAGGHSAALLSRHPALSILGLDVDADALAIARERLAPFGQRATIQHSSYIDIQQAAVRIGWDSVDMILLDLGVSSMQVDRAERGFAFMQDGPLDMRFDATGDGITAADIVNGWDADELAEIFYNYGEERHGRKIARAIVQDRPFERTADLAALITRVTPRSKERIHPATRVFQALRIAVNDELYTIKRTLPAAVDLLSPGGRLAVISFHSLEDRIVKGFFKVAATSIESPPGMMLEEKAATVKLITRKPIIADADEIEANPRSRSAKLRIVEKL